MRSPRKTAAARPQHRTRWTVAIVQTRLEKENSSRPRPRTGAAGQPQGGTHTQRSRYASEGKLASSAAESRNEGTGTGSRRHTTPSDLLSTSGGLAKASSRNQASGARLGAQEQSKLLCGYGEVPLLDTSGSPSSAVQGTPALRLRACVSGGARWPCSGPENARRSPPAHTAHTGHRLLHKHAAYKDCLPARPTSALCGALGSLRPQEHEEALGEDTAACGPEQRTPRAALSGIPSGRAAAEGLGAASGLPEGGVLCVARAWGETSGPRSGTGWSCPCHSM